MSTTELQVRQGLYEEFMSLNKENFAKVEKYIRRLSRAESAQREESVMSPLSLEEKIGRLKEAENDIVCYTQQEMRQHVASWRKA